MREIKVKNTKLRDFSELDGLNPLHVFTKHRGCPKDLHHTNIVYHNIIGKIPHNNFVEYLKIAYNTDYGIIIKPDFIWYTILCELSYMVRNNEEEVRKYFTYKKKKKIVLTGHNDSLIQMPIDQLVDLVFEHIPMDLKKEDVIPGFTTSDDDSRFALSAAFLEMVSNYYTYDWVGCDYNKIKILGEPSDYELMLTSLDRFNRIVPLQEYISIVKDAVRSIINNWMDDDFWRNILWTKHGYGGDRVDGWIKLLFNEGRYWNAHLSQVEATELITNKTYVTVTGLLSSKVEDGYLVPNFERIIAEKNIIDKESKEMDWDYFSRYDSLLSMAYNRKDGEVYSGDDWNKDAKAKPKPNPKIKK